MSNIFGSLTDIESISPKQILIVNDSPDKRELLKTIVDRFAIGRYIDVFLREDSPSALKHFESYDRVLASLIDYDMPGGTGPELIRAMREIEAAEHRIRRLIALVTECHGNDFNRKNKEALEAGADLTIDFNSGNHQRIAQIDEFLHRIVESGLHIT